MAKPRSKFKKTKWLFGKEIEVPEEWKLERLGNVCKIRKSSSISSDLYIGLEHIGQGNNLTESTGNVNEFTSTKNTFSQGDVLYGKLRPLLNKVWLATESGYCSTDILPLVPTNKILSQILLFVLTNHDFLWYAVGTSAGTKMPRTSWSDMKKFPVVLSNIQEQQKIASILSGVDALIESTQKVIEKMERLKKGLMQKLLTKGIGHTKFKKTKWLFGKEIEIPQEWNVTRLIEQCIQKPKYGAGESAIEKDLKLPRYIRITDLNDDGSLRNKEWKSIKENAAKDYLLNYNDILFARTGATVGKSYLYTGEDGRCAFAGYLIKFQPDQTKLNSKFLFHYIHSIYYWKYIKSIQTWGVQPNINAEQYSNLLILLPPIHEQQKIASILSGVDAYIQKNQKYKKKMELLKKGLMQKLLTGQIRVKVNH